MRIGMMVLIPLVAGALFFLPFSNGAQRLIFGSVVAVVLAMPVVLALGLLWWAYRKPRQPGKDYRGIPVVAAVLSFLITAVPLPPMDRSPSLITYAMEGLNRTRVPIPLQRLGAGVQGLFDECQEQSDCDSSDGTLHRCAKALDGERMCVEVSDRGCCPTEAGCTEGTVCVWLTDPTRDGRTFGANSTNGCVSAEVASRFRELQPAPSCVRRLPRVYD